MLRDRHQAEEDGREGVVGGLVETAAAYEDFISARNACPEGWPLKTGFLLGVHLPVPAEIDPKAILRGMRNAGYYIWREGMPCGTTR